MIELLLVIGVLIVVSGLLVFFGGGLAFVWLLWSCWRARC